MTCYGQHDDVRIAGGIGKGADGCPGAVAFVPFGEFARVAGTHSYLVAVFEKAGAQCTGHDAGAENAYFVFHWWLDLLMQANIGNNCLSPR